MSMESRGLGAFYSLSHSCLLTTWRGCWEQNSDPLEEQYALLTTEQALQFQQVSKKIKIISCILSDCSGAKPEIENKRNYKTVYLSLQKHRKLF